jgi:hypothetical protein
VESCERSNAAAREIPILDPQNDHLSFYAPNLADVVAILREQEIEFVRQTVEDQNVDQVSRLSSVVIPWKISSAILPVLSKGVTNNQAGILSLPTENRVTVCEFLMLSLRLDSDILPCSGNARHD